MNEGISRITDICKVVLYKNVPLGIRPNVFYRK